MEAHLLTRPYDGFKPYMPQYEAGNRIEPPVSVPNALQSRQYTFARIERHNIRETHATSHSRGATAAASSGRATFREIVRVDDRAMNRMNV